MFGAPLRRLREAGCKVNFYQPITLVPAAPPEQPDAPRAAGRRRPRRFHRRRRRRRLVAEAAHDGSRRGATRWRASKGRSWRRCRASSPRTGSSAAARSSRRRGTGRALDAGGPAEAMLVKSSPSDRATASRVVFQMLIEGAVTSIDISTPYFLPDRSLRRALVRAAQRGVRVRVIVPGQVHRSAAGAARQPADVSRAARQAASASSSTGRR